MRRLGGLILFFSALTSMAQVQRNRTFGWEYPGPIDQVTHFTLYWGTTAGGPYTLGKAVIPVGVLQGTVTLPKGTYYFVVTAGNEDSESGYSNEAATTIYDNAMKPINFKIVVGTP